MIKVCRLCLNSGIQLFDVFNSNIAENVENIVGLLMKPNDKLPSYICAVCKCMLFKCESFVKRCQTAEQLLNKGLFEHDKITMAYIQSIDRSLFGLTLPFSTHHTNLNNELSLSNNKQDDYNCEFVDTSLECNDRVKSGDIVDKSRDFDVEIVDYIDESGNYIDESRDFVVESEEYVLESEDYGDVVEVMMDDFSHDEDTVPLEKTYKKIINKHSRGTKTCETEETSTLDETLEQDQISDQDQTSEQDPTSEQEQTSEPEPIYQSVNRSYQLEYATLIYRDIEEQRQDLESRKETDNYKHSPFKCGYCFKGFIDEQCFENHMEKHAPSSGSYVCEICQIRCQNPGKLKQHKLTVHEKKYICKKCDHKSHTLNQAKFHELWHKGYTYHCDQCGETFTKCTSHLTHMRVHHPSNYICHICSSPFLGLRGLNSHIKKMHKNTKVQAQESYCKTCDVYFKSHSLFKKHIMTSEEHKDDNVYIHLCKLCDDGFETESELLQHTKIHTQSFVQCKECNRKFSNHRRCAEHYRKVHLGIVTTTKDSELTSIVCEICGMICYSPAALVNHQRVHTGEKPFKCTQCPKSFPVKQNLVLHERTHSGERPYLCALCPKTFASKAAINRHARVHTGEKPYTCTHCLKSFTQSNSMKLHIRTVHHKLPALYKSKRNKAKQAARLAERERSISTHTIGTM